MFAAVQLPPIPDSDSESEVDVAMTPAIPEPVQSTTIATVVTGEPCTRCNRPFKTADGFYQFDYRCCSMKCLRAARRDRVQRDLEAAAEKTRTVQRYNDVGRGGCF